MRSLRPVNAAMRSARVPRPWRSPSTLLLLALLALPGAACTFTPSGGDTFEEAVYLYGGADGDKALALAAVAREGRGRSAWGAASGRLTQGGANEKALEACRENARRAGVEAPCHLFAVGDVPAPETVAACRTGRLDPYRCELQRRHQSALDGGSD